MAEIKHVVVLMMENRSFDSMLGRLYPSGPNFNGLVGTESNQWNGQSHKVWTSPQVTPAMLRIPEPGPGEDFVDMTEQIFGAGAPAGAAADMSGFVSNYMRKHPGGDPRTPMHGFTPDQLPGMRDLARSFAVSDCWHASAPNQTWPNRFFVHTGTAGGYVNNSPKRAPFKMPTIYNRLTKKQRSWRIYFHDTAHAMLLSKIWSEVPDHLYHFDQFQDDAQRGALPSYSFIEPRYFTLPLSKLPNDQHPSHDVSLGDRLMLKCYDALRRGPGWSKTLFIITYDEHGGMYDHVPPPAAASPDNFQPDKFAFDRYGVRVPALIISPWIPAGSVIRPPTGSKYPFDHTSILSTLNKLYGLGAPLTGRDAVAPDLLHALSLPAPTNNGPANIALSSATPTPKELAASELAPPNGMQRALAEAAPVLPSGSADISTHLEGVAAIKAAAAPPPKTAEEARQRAVAGVRRFVGGPWSMSIKDR